MHIFDWRWTLQDIPHQGPWTSWLVSLFTTMLTKWCSLSLSSSSAGHVQTDHLTLQLPVEKTFSCIWTQHGAAGSRVPGCARLRRAHNCTLRWKVSSGGLFLSRSLGDVSLSLSVLLQSSSFLTWPCWAAARLCRGAAHLLRTRKRRSWCRWAAFYYKRSWRPFQKRTDPAFNPRWDKSRCEVKNRGCRKASETDGRARLDVPECFPSA